MSKPITLTDLLAEIGNDNIAVQPLSPAVTDMAARQGYSEITFGTEITLSPSGCLSKVGLILWVDTDAYDAAVKRLKDGFRAAVVGGGGQ